MHARPRARPRGLPQLDRDDQLRYSANLTPIGSARPPGSGEVVRVRDVLLIPGSAGANPDGVDLSELAMFPTLDIEQGRRDAEPIDLGRGLSLTRLDGDEAEIVLTACSSRGHYFVPVRQFGQMYSFVREVDLAEIDDARWAWDRDDVIRDAVAMSRLILDNGYSTEYAARIFEYDEGEQQVMPIPIVQYAYRVRPTAREWMKTSEAHELRDLLAAYWAAGDELPDRVAHSIWNAEYLVSSRFLDVIAPLIVVALEALVNTSRQLVTRQFAERVPPMTAEAGSPVSQSDCEQMYSARSRWVHGSRVPSIALRGRRASRGKGRQMTSNGQRSSASPGRRTVSGRCCARRSSTPSFGRSSPPTQASVPDGPWRSRSPGCGPGVPRLATDGAYCSRPTGRRRRTASSGRRIKDRPRPARLGPSPVPGHESSSLGLPAARIRQRDEFSRRGIEAARRAAEASFASGEHRRFGRRYPSAVEPVDRPTARVYGRFRTGTNWL